MRKRLQNVYSQIKQTRLKPLTYPIWQPRLNHLLCNLSPTNLLPTVVYFRFLYVPSSSMKTPLSSQVGNLVFIPAFNVFSSVLDSAFLESLCVLLPLENLLWAKLRDYVISRVNTCSRVIGTWSPRSSTYRPFAWQASTSRLPEPPPLTVYRAVPQVPPPLCR
jgi:hypothetical protein